MREARLAFAGGLSNPFSRYFLLTGYTPPAILLSAEYNFPDMAQDFVQTLENPNADRKGHSRRSQMETVRMKQIMRLAMIMGVFVLTTSGAPAQSTNVVQHANFVLKGTKQT